MIKKNIELSYFYVRKNIEIFKFITYAIKNSFKNINMLTNMSQE